MSGTPLSDAGVGRALFTTRITLSIQAFKMCVLIGALPGLLLPFVLWFYLAAAQSVDLVRLNAVSHVVADDTPARWRLTGPDGERRVVEAVLSDGRFIEWLTPAQIRAVLAKPLSSAMTTFTAIEIASLLCGIAGFLLTQAWLRRLGGSSQKDKRIRGAFDLVPLQELSALVRGEGGGRYTLAGVALPKDAPQRGIQTLGAQGSGKSVALHDLMRQVFRAKGRKAIIYDQSGEFFRAYFRPGKDYFFNPALIGSVPWSIFEEIKYTYDADTMARAFLPPKAGVVSGGMAFFEDAARALFSVILARLKARGACDTRDIAKAFLEMPADEMEHLIAKSVASSAVGGDSAGQRQGVISSIAIYLNGIAAVAPGSWSVRQFITEPGDARLFILGTSDTRTMFAPLYRLMLTALNDSIEAKGEIVHEDRYWEFLDEAATLGDIRLDEVVATKRKYGVVVVTGIQSDTQFVQSMGTERAATVANCFNTNLVLACNEPGLQERSAKLLGKQELDTVSRNQALANNESRDGAALNRSDSEKWLVMPSQLGTLDTCTGFIKVAGAFPVAGVDYRSWLRKSFWGGHAPVDLGAPVVPIPERDPRFMVTINSQGSTDPFDQVRVELESLKQAAAEELAASLEATSPKQRGTAAVAAPNPPAGDAPEFPEQALLLTRGRRKGARDGQAGHLHASDVAQSPADTPPAEPAAPAPAPMRAGGRGQPSIRGQAEAPLLRAVVDADTGEILGKLDNKGLAMTQAMDMTKPGHTLGFDLGAEQ
jgi:hypothetical protein